jgi:hypothetical protein
MALQPTTYTSIPKVIDAIQWDGTAEHANLIVEWIQENGGQAEAYWSADTSLIRIHTLVGVMGCEPGGYVVHGLEGEFYPATTSVFEKSYRPLEIHP